MPQSQYTLHSLNIFGPSWHVQGLCFDQGKKRPESRLFTPEKQDKTGGEMTQGFEPGVQSMTSQSQC
jgi:hypothetical protein